MPSAWHTPEDPREFSEAPLDLACDTPGCVGIVRIAAEDWHPEDNDGIYCRACVAATVCGPHPGASWPETLPAEED